MNATITQDIENILTKIHENVKINMHNGDTLMTFFVIIFMFMCGVTIKMWCVFSDMRKRLRALEIGNLNTDQTF